LTEHVSSSSVNVLPGIDLESTNHVLHTLELFNWGPFNGFHKAEFDERGSAVIGMTGSGKTTLIDGLMTLLVPQPKYNLASTGGHESDRTLMSYVRGALGGGGEFHAEYSRPGKTVTGLCATYKSLEGAFVRQGCVLWTDGAGGAADDLKRRWIFCRTNEETLEKWLRILDTGGSRSLMRHGKETAQLRVFDSKRAYLAHNQKYFDVSSNAFTLLNRAAGLKQINSIDEIFRDLVLDDHSQFDRAMEVAGDFDNLVAIHSEMETAKRQLQSLRPILEHSEKRNVVKQQEIEWQKLKGLIPAWFATLGEKLWSEKIQKCESALLEQEKLHQAELQTEAHEQEVCGVLYEKYLSMGGGRLNDLEGRIRVQERRVEEVQKSADEYLRVIGQLELEGGLNEENFNRNQKQVLQKIPRWEKDKEQRRNEWAEAQIRSQDEAKRLTELEDDLGKAKSRKGSSIPVKQQDFRDLLGQQLRLSPDELPFLAELIEVKAEEQSWRGAIERAVGSERLRIIVPASRAQEALRWVNSRHNQLHVRLLSTDTSISHREAFSDGFIQKLNFKEHQYSQLVRRYLASRDRHCVASSDELRSTEFGLTMQGMMSDRRGRFEKQDQRNLSADWMTGFDNKAQLQILEEEIHRLREIIVQRSEAASHHKKREDELSHLLIIAENLTRLDFDTINLSLAEKDLEHLRNLLNELKDPTKDVGLAKKAYEEKKNELQQMGSRIRDYEVSIKTTQKEIEVAQAKVEECAKIAGNGLDDQEVQFVTTHLPESMVSNEAEIDRAQQESFRQVDDQLEKIRKRISELEKTLIRLMGIAKNEDTGALADTRAELSDLEDYTNQHILLTEEALPEKIDQFREYLTRSSDQGVTQLLASIGEEVDEIERRITQLNETLSKVEYRSGRYLQLKPIQIGNEKLRNLNQAQRHLTTVAIEDEEGQRHFKALKRIIEILREAAENRRLVGSRALLDPRYRLEFRVVEVDRETGAYSAPRSGSQSGSGGEKELMASHILTASLSYALCPVGSDRPLYGTVVLDEAFSKSSPSAAGRIIHALRTFGLHPIFVTPNKEIGLLKRHTHKVILVHRKGDSATLGSISWEQLDEIKKSNEVA